MPAEALTVALTPIQDLHGYDHPWAGGAGKNKLPLTLTNLKALNTGGTWNGNTYTLKGIDLTVITDSDDNIIGLVSNGTASDDFTFYLQKDITSATYPDQVIINGCVSAVNGVFFRVQLTASPWTVLCDNYSGDTSFTIPSTGSYQIIIRIYNGVTVSNKAFYPMIRLATVTDATFAPYTNICPISGRASTNVSTTDGEDTESVSIAFGTTVYGGTVNFNTGVVTVDMAIVDMGSLSWTYDGGIFRATLSGSKMPPTINTKAEILSEIYETDTSNNVNAKTTDGTIALHTVNNLLWVYDSRYTDPTVYTAAINGVQLCYELETPTTLQLTPDELTMLKGDNSVTGDGVITITAYTGSSYPVEITRKRKTKKKGGK